MIMTIDVITTASLIKINIIVIIIIIIIENLAINHFQDSHLFQL